MVEKKTGGKTINWEAEEYVQIRKNGGWYAGLFVVCAVLAVGAGVLGWWSTVVVIILSAIALTMYSKRAPRQLQYSLSDRGLVEGGKAHDLAEYKEFGVADDGEGHYAIVLTPRMRFAPRYTIYFPKERGEEIVDFFGARLPMVDVKYDFIDKIVRTLRL